MPQSNFWFDSKAIVVYAVSLLALAEIIDLTIVAIAIPQIMGALGADLDSIAMVTTSYIVAATGFIPLSGIVIRKYGMKQVVLASAVMFTIASVLCGIASSLTTMILFRILQGIGGAFLPSVAQSYIVNSYSGEERQKMISLFGLIVVMGPVLGPLLGGALCENLSWRWIFYVNVPICAVGAALVAIFMKKEPLIYTKIDHVSFVFMMLGLGSLEYFIDQGNQQNWLHSIKMVIILCTALLSLSFFIWRGLLGKSVANFSLFKNSNFVLSCLGMFSFMMLVTGALAYFPTMLQQVYGYPVNIAGYITAPRGLAAIVAAPLIPIITNQIGMKITMVFGILIFAFSCFMLAGFGPEVSESYILLTMILQGFSMMGFFVPIMQICFVGFAEEQTADVSGIFNFFRNFACSVGNSICATIVSHQSQVNYHDLGANISPYANGFAWWRQHLPDISEQLQIAIAQAQMMEQALLVSYIDSYYIFGVLLLLLLWLPMTLQQPSLVRTTHAMH